MKRSSAALLFPLLLVAAASSTAVAGDGDVTWLGTSGTEERPFVVAASSRGLVFIGADHQVYRTFQHEQTALEGTEQPFLYVLDLNNDGAMDFAGAGDPSFVVTHEGEPLWGINDGCEQFFVGNFYDDPSMEVFCRSADLVRIWSWDGQLVLEWEGGRRDMGVCYADDYDGDRQTEVQCELTNGNHVSFDLDFAEPEEVEQPVTPATQSGVDTSAVASAASGASALTVGSAEVTLGFADGAIQWSSGGVVTPIPVGATGIYSATVADLNADGSSEVYVGGTDAVYVLSESGAVLATVAANPTNVSRDARVTVRTATANGLEVSDRDTIRGIIEAQGARLTGCYADRMGSDPYTRTGEMIVELTVNGSGAVSNSTQRHSSLRNESLEGCVVGVLEDLTFSGATEGTGIVNVTVDFDFVDAPR